jgi:adenylate kinase
MSDSRFRAVLLFGYPGCGKGTQGAVLGQLPNLCHLAMGDIFRALDKQSDIGREFLSYSTEGLLVPDELTVRVWNSHVDGLVSEQGLNREYHTLLLDGIPRTPSQVELMDEQVDVRKIIHLSMADEGKLMQRLKGRALKSNRPDDADDAVIRKRIEVYKAETSPVLGAYDKSLIADINADQSPLGALRDIAAALDGEISANI